MVFADCSKKDLEDRTRRGKEETPLFNLSIKLNDWKGPFEHFDYFLNIGKIAQEYASLRGEHYIDSNGNIKGGKIAKLKTFEAEIDLTQKDHIHYGSDMRGILKLISPTKVDPIDLPSLPRYK